MHSERANMDDETAFSVYGMATIGNLFYHQLGF